MMNPKPKVMWSAVRRVWELLKLFLLTVFGLVVDSTTFAFTKLVLFCWALGLLLAAVLALPVTWVVTLFSRDRGDLLNVHLYLHKEKLSRFPAAVWLIDGGAFFEEWARGMNNLGIEEQLSFYKRMMLKCKAAEVDRGS